MSQLGNLRSTLLGFGFCLVENEGRGKKKRKTWYKRQLSPLKTNMDAENTPFLKRETSTKQQFLGSSRCFSGV